MKKILIISTFAFISATSQSWSEKDTQNIHHKEAKTVPSNNEDATLFSITGGLTTAYEQAKKLGNKVLDAAKSAARFGISAVKSVVDIATKYGPDIAPKVVALAKIVGPFVFDLTKKYGLDAINLIYKYGPSTVKSIVAKYGDKVVGYAMDYGPKVFELVAKYGPTAFDMLTKLGAAALKTL